MPTTYDQLEKNYREARIEILYLRARIAELEGRTCEMCARNPGCARFVNVAEYCPIRHMSIKKLNNCSAFEPKKEDKI